MPQTLSKEEQEQYHFGGVFPAFPDILHRNFSPEPLRRSQRQLRTLGINGQIP